MEEVKLKRTAREIKVSESLLKNRNINVKIGTVENRDSPETIYIIISFWAKPSEKLSDEPQEHLKEILNTRFGDLYKNELKDFLKNNKYFINEQGNIFIKNIPENINYNNKRNFISLELYLHTLNIERGNNLPLSNKKNTELFDEAVKIVNIIGKSDVLSKEKEFKIFKKSMG